MIGNFDGKGVLMVENLENVRRELAGIMDVAEVALVLGEMEVADYGLALFMDNVLAFAVTVLIEDEPENVFRGDPGKLLGVLNGRVSDVVLFNCYWPKDGRSLVKSLSRIDPILKRFGVSFRSRRTNGRLIVTLTSIVKGK